MRAIVAAPIASIMLIGREPIKEPSRRRIKPDSFDGDLIVGLLYTLAIKIEPEGDVFFSIC